MNPSIDVLVVGAGPTGTALAIDLARRGLAVRIVDKSAGSFEGSRAKGLQPRTLEVLEDLGALDAVLASGSIYPRLGIHLGPFTIPWRMMSERSPTPEVPYPNTWLIPQFSTDGLLHARLAALGVSVEFGTELVDFEQDGDEVRATVAAGDENEVIIARHLVGADGGSSRVRRCLGVGFTGSTDEEDRMILIDATVVGDRLSRDRWHIWPGRRGRFVGACPLPHSDLFQWMIRLAPDEEPDLSSSALNARIRRRTGAHIELGRIQWTSVFRPNIRLADAYRVGRVFLAGDAAHVHTPAGAQGLNTGVQDGYNLGWKLGQVLAGADPTLLDSYESERRPIAASVLGLSTRKYNAIGSLDPSSIKRGKDEQQLSITYFGGPLAPGVRGSGLSPGDRAPDATLVDDEGRRSRLFERLAGPHFTAIATGPRSATALEQLEWPRRGASLTRVQSRDYASSSTLERSYGGAGDALFLVRPDGYIGHVATEDMLESTHAAAAQMTPGGGGA